ncbi:MAG TPA: gamma-glutamyltransferase [Candidatus Limnocylindrales bacterium]|jgi:gamma-glutamyltranspeptidase/glutathione hydrolase
MSRPVSRPLVPAFLARGSHGAVVAPHHLATAAGLGILRAGGTAVDAAIATNAVLAVVDNEACGLGGDAFWLIWDEAAKAQAGLNGSGRSSSRASAADLRSRGLLTVPHRGGLSITVPGAIRSWGDAHDRFGRLPRADLLAPAIELARDGFPADDAFCRAVEVSAPLFERELGAGAAGWSAVYRPADRPWQPGERVRLPALAKTLERIAVAGWAEPYEGETAHLQATALAAAGSAIGLDDLRSHASTWTEPIFTDYRGVRVTGHPPNSSGFVALELLNILETFEPPSAAGGAAATVDAAIRWAHLGIEASKLVMADRDAHLTDPEHHRTPLERLLDKDYARLLAWRIDPDQATAPIAARVPRGGGTIWLGVVDGQGNAVSLIQSNYAGFGSGIVDPATGIAYQNRGSYFGLDEDHPNVLGPSKRTLHTLMPAMLFRAGRPWVIVGSMGGDAQPQVHAQVVSALVDAAADVATAVAEPRWFVEPAEHYAPPDTVRIEPRFGSEVLDGLAAMGHPVVATEPFDGALGHCHAIELVAGGPAAGGTLAAATDPRSQGLPATW